MTNRRGFALIAVLWIVVIVTAIGLEFSLNARARRLATINTVDDARSRAAARAGLATSVARLERLLNVEGREAGALLDPWFDLRRIAMDSASLGDSRYSVELRDAGSRLNVNRATEEEWRRLFSALRIDAGDADRLAQALADWRDADDLHRPRGAERREYEEAGALVLPSNAPFAHVREIRHVRGMTPAIFEQVEPYLTVLGDGRVNLNQAALPVLLAIEGIGPEAAAAIERLRYGSDPLTNLHDLPLALSKDAREALEAALPSILSRTTLTTQEVEVRVEARAIGGVVRAELEALVARAGTSAVVTWRRQS